MGCTRNHDAEGIVVYKGITEYQLPAAGMTHEMVIIPAENDLLLISQQEPSRLLKMRLDDAGIPFTLESFGLGTGIASGLHGLTISAKYPGCLWATLENDNTILLLDPSKHLVIRSKIQLPPSVKGPHAIIESGDYIWSTCKESGHLVKAHILDLSKEEPISIYSCNGKPTYVAVHPSNGDVYASLDSDNKLIKFPAGSESPIFIDIPPSAGTKPLAVVAGPDGNLWITLLIPANSKSGVFGRISGDGVITWFTLPAPPQGLKIGFITVAFDDNFYTATQGKLLRLWLLSSTGVSKESVDAVFTVVVQGNRIVRQDTMVMPTHASNTHRVIRHKSDLYVSELSQSQLVHLKGEATGLINSTQHCSCGPSCACPPPCNCSKSGHNPFKLPRENSDAYDVWGFGVQEDNLTYQLPKDLALVPDVDVAVSASRPGIGTKVGGKGVKLEWLSKLDGNLIYKVYLGRDYKSVRDTTTTTFVTTMTSANIGELAQGFWFWRVDIQVNGELTIIGSTWTFQVIPEPSISVYHQGTDGWLWYTTFDGKGWESDKRVLYTGTSMEPSLIDFNEKLFCFHQGQENTGELWYNVFDGSRWEGDIRVQNTSHYASPSVIMHRNKLYCFHQGGGNCKAQLFYNVFNGTNWEGDKIVQDSSMSSSPSVVSFNDKIYCFYQRANWELWYRTFDGTNWEAETLVPHVGTSGRPSLVVFNEKLYCFHQGPDNNAELWFNIFDGRQWLGDKMVDKTRLLNEPGALVFQNKIYCLYNGYTELWYNVFNGSNWEGDKKVYNVGISAYPSPICSSTYLCI